MLSELLHEHTVLRNLGYELLDRTSRAELYDPTALAHCRARLMISVSEHILFEAEVVKEADARGRPIVPNAKRIERQLEGWMKDFAMHGRRWTNAAVAVDWDGYRKSEQSLLGRLFDHLDTEERDLYPALRSSMAR